MTTLDVLFFPSQIRNRILEESAVVVVDVLRATTSIVAALSAGAEAVLPVRDEQEARRITAELRETGESVLLCGEVGGFPPEGFDLGNSPRDFESADLRGKRIILKTTNGTVALSDSMSARLVVAGSLTNVSSVAEFLHGELKSGNVQKVIVLCAGGEGEFGLEDFFAAGALLNRMIRLEETIVELTDSAVAALDYYQNGRNEASEIVACSHHGRELVEIGLADDIPRCSAEDIYRIVPLCDPDGWLYGVNRGENTNI